MISSSSTPMPSQVDADVTASVPRGTDISPRPPTRPPFHTRITADRLREGFCVHPPPIPMIGKIKKGRRSHFKELELDEYDDDDEDGAQSDKSIASPTYTTSTLDVGSSSHASHLSHRQSDSVDSSGTASPVAERDFDAVGDQSSCSGVDGCSIGGHMLCENEDGRMENVEGDVTPRPGSRRTG